LSEIQDTFDNAVDAALSMLPPRMDSRDARVQLATTMLQESRGIHRRQINGPARGLWQFEPGTRRSRGGVWGVYLHDASREHLRRLCSLLRCEFDPRAIYKDLEFDDVLAAGVARLLLWTDPRPLPAVDDIEGSWAYYLRNWKPGRPHPETWPEFRRTAIGMVP